MNWARPDRTVPSKVGFLLIFLLGGCCSTTSQAPETIDPEAASEPAVTPAPAAAAAESVEYDVPQLDRSQVSELFSEQCERAVASGLPLLVEFTASWCPDCVRLFEMEQQEPLRGELAQWPTVFVNVDQPAQHRELMRGFEVGAIAHWSVTRPTDCSQPPTEWPRGESRTLEPVSGDATGETPESLAEWLRGQR